MAIKREHMDFAGVYQTHVERVYGFLAYRLQDRQETEDLTQATFERALRSWGRFDPSRASQITWLLSIAQNLIIDYHRRGRVITVELVDDSCHLSAAGPEEVDLRSTLLVGALGELSERDREVIALRFGADLSGQAIADFLDLSLANVHQILSRSLRKLRTLLAEP